MAGLGLALIYEVFDRPSLLPAPWRVVLYGPVSCRGSVSGVFFFFFRFFVVLFFKGNRLKQKRGGEKNPDPQKIVFP